LRRVALICLIFACAVERYVFVLLFFSYAMEM
jgi:hypothetical protein